MRGCIPPGSDLIWQEEKRVRVGKQGDEERCVLIRHLLDSNPQCQICQARYLIKTSERLFGAVFQFAVLIGLHSEIKVLKRMNFLTLEFILNNKLGNMNL